MVVSMAARMVLKTAETLVLMMVELKAVLRAWRMAVMMARMMVE